MKQRRSYAVMAAVLLAAAALATIPEATGSVSAMLTRYPYLTDLVENSVTVNWATDRSATKGSVSWGSVNGDACALTRTTPALRFALSVGTVREYQWTTSLTLPASGRFCYRVNLGSTDLLGSDPSPQFESQVPVGSTDPFSFAVFGDWGMVDANGANLDQANVMRQIAQSGARFGITTGDNAYQSGSQLNYGDLQQVGPNTSTVFGPEGWPVAGKSIPLFPIMGNHGMGRSDAINPQFFNWPQNHAVNSSSGRYESEKYCCLNGTTTASYPSAWYAFDAGNARFYVLHAAWADNNLGTATDYKNDFDYHWQPTSAEYQWLQADLAAHPEAMKFAFFHYPLAADNPDEGADPFLGGPDSLEGLLASNGVKLGFSGHAHLYQRNLPAYTGGLLNYVTGGGGATPEPIGPCTVHDAYGIGWSASKLVGTKCGAAPVPTSGAQVFHFLKVTVDGTTVTVTPTDSLGNTFDVQTYDFSGGTAVAETILDGGPNEFTKATDATFSFHSDDASSSFECFLDGASLGGCTSPTTVGDLAEGVHAFSVAATNSVGTDLTPATSSWATDVTGPAPPPDLAPAGVTTTSISLTWSPASDPSGIASYTVYRDGASIGTTTATEFTDGGATPSTAYQYAVSATDGAGNEGPVSASIPVSSADPLPPIFSDGFESGGFSEWTVAGGLVVQSDVVHGGTNAARGATTNGATYAKKTLPGTYPDGYARLWFNVASSSSQINLARFRTAADASIGYLFMTAGGQLGWRNDVAKKTITSSALAPAGSGWHSLELHVGIGPDGSTEVWLDGVRVDALSVVANLGTSGIGRFQIGEVQPNRTYDVTFDDVAFSSSRLGP